nr:FMN-binding negative transcriptional regulator [Pontibacter aydingkolensis]
MILHSSTQKKNYVHANPLPGKRSAKADKFMREFSFATLVTIQDNKPFATHLPFVVENRNEQLILQTHVAKQNPQWKDLKAGQEALVIFQEPHAYISPALYEKQLNVPTWNYCAVHAYGKPTII